MTIRSLAGPMRSWLFVPGDQPAKMAKAVAGSADIVLIDLEDAVVADAKPAARGHAHDFIAALEGGGASASGSASTRSTGRTPWSTSRR